MLKKIKLFICTALLTISFFTSKAQDEITLELTTNVNAAIQAEKATLESLKNDLCKQVDALSYDVTKLGNGSLSYPNWVRFVQIAEQIEDLNETWNEAYGNALNSIIQTAIDEGQFHDDERSKDLASDIIEENHLVFPGDMASVCFESKFDFISLRKCLEDQENSWLDQSGDDFNAGNSPTFNEEIDDEMFWTLMDCEKRFTIENKDVDETMLEGLDEDQQLKLLTIIKDIVAIVKDVVNIAETLHGIFKDCGGTYQIKERDLKDGITIPNNGGWIGYFIRQKGVNIDFADKTTTKIKGKAKLYVEKNSGKRKRDRKNKASLGYCTKQWNNCGNREWPSDTEPWWVMHKDGSQGIRKIKDYKPYALTIDKSTHFLKFNFGKNGIYVETIYLFGNTNTGCPIISSTIW